MKVFLLCLLSLLAFSCSDDPASPKEEAPAAVRNLNGSWIFNLDGELWPHPVSVATVVDRSDMMLSHWYDGYYYDIKFASADSLYAYLDADPRTRRVVGLRMVTLDSMVGISEVYQSEDGIYERISHSDFSGVRQR